MSLETLTGKSLLIVEDEYRLATDLASLLSSAGVDIVAPLQMWKMRWTL